jgi:hypothetical protein
VVGVSDGDTIAVLDKLSTEMDSVDYARTDWSNSNWAEL